MQLYGLIEPFFTLIVEQSVKCLTKTVDVLYYQHQDKVLDTVLMCQVALSNSSLLVGLVYGSGYITPPVS